jgi:hypothetical protein
MAVHIGKLTSEVTLHDVDVGLTPSQIERIVALVISRLEERAREAERNRCATAIHRHASKQLGGKA